MPRTKTTGTKPSIAKVSKPKASARGPKPGRRDVVAADRERFLKMLREAGLRVGEIAAWAKVTGKDGRRLYVQKRGSAVHMTFPLKVAGAVPVSEAEARKRHIGSIRTIVRLDRQRSDVLLGVFRAAIAEMR